MDVAFYPAHLAAKFHAAEAAKEASMRADAELMAALMSARSELKVSAPAAQRVIGAVVESIAQTGKAQEALCQAHTSAEALGRKMGLRTTMTGVWKELTGVLVDSDRPVASQVA